MIQQQERRLHVTLRKALGGAEAEASLSAHGPARSSTEVSAKRQQRQMQTNVAKGVDLVPGAAITFVLKDTTVRSENKADTQVTELWRETN